MPPWCSWNRRGQLSRTLTQVYQIRTSRVDTVSLPETYTVYIFLVSNPTIQPMELSMTKKRLQWRCLIQTRRTLSTQLDFLTTPPSGNIYGDGSVLMLITCMLSAKVIVVGFKSHPFELDLLRNDGLLLAWKPRNAINCTS